MSDTVTPDDGLAREVESAKATSPTVWWSRVGTVLLVSCYELGRQPFNIASPWAQLEQAGFGVTGVDASIEDVSQVSLEHTQLVAISVPMHTALRLGTRLARELRERAPAAHFCFFGMYAALNAAHLLDTEADSVIGGEFEEALVHLAESLRDHGQEAPRAVAGVVRSAHELEGSVAEPVLRRLPFVVPKRDELPQLGRYATFFGPQPDEIRKVGYIEATRGCLHECRHCPVTAVYRGRFFVVPQEVVVADALQQIAAGAGHITFGDPDFFNGPKHGMAVIRAIAAQHPNVSFDVTVKVEHILRHRARIEELGQLGCAFIISAVESLSDEVLARLHKGHTRRDVIAALAVCREAGVPLRPTFVSFTPWTTLDDYIDVVDWIVREGLIDHVEPIQLAIRLLVPPGSALLWEQDETAWLGPLDVDALGYTWKHPDERLDALYEEVSRIVEERDGDDPELVIRAIREAAYRAAGRPLDAIPSAPRRFVPHLSESWFCCAEPTARQMERVTGNCRTPSSCD